MVEADKLDRDFIGTYDPATDIFWVKDTYCRELLFKGVGDLYASKVQNDVLCEVKMKVRMGDSTKVKKYIVVWYHEIEVW
jgi:hypothetical protein